mmetsp:Transcript_62008/g.103081  ORF Transcript_62008/g.103081 Transcript_62008/m.103081 type:complete len:96 (-) Transcript_62008:639-926(-)
MTTLTSHDRLLDADPPATRFIPNNVWSLRVPPTWPHLLHHHQRPGKTAIAVSIPQHFTPIPFVADGRERNPCIVDSKAMAEATEAVRDDDVAMEV